MTLARKRWSFTDAPQDRFGLLVMLLVASFLVSGIDRGGGVRLVASLLNLAALVVGFTSTRRFARRWVLAALVGVGVAGSVLVTGDSPESLAAAIGASLEVVVLGALTIAVVFRVVSHERVNNQTILGAIAAYFLIGQVFAWAYLALPGYLDEPILDPANAGELPIYYSYVVLTTLGFGDITPVTALAERITVLESITGQMFLAILVARLVSVYARDRQPSDS